MRTPFPHSPFMVIVAIAFLAMPSIAHGQLVCPEGQRQEVDRCVPIGSANSAGLINPIGGTTENPEGTADIPSILGTVLRYAFGLLGSLALAMFIYGGFLWLTSGGSTERIEKGKNTMVWAILGIAVAFTAYTIVNFVIGVLTNT